MAVVTRTDLLEIVPELRAMAEAAQTPTVRETLTLLADRYAAMAFTRRVGRPGTSPRKSPALDIDHGATRREGVESRLSRSLPDTALRS
jgi:hypothetical protein